MSGRTLRRIIRSAAERTVTGLGWARRAREKLRDHVVIVAYHNVVPDEMAGMGDVSLHLPLGSFRRQLDFLAAEFEVIPLSALLADRGESGRPRAAITFDDGYRGATRLAPPELAARGLPATMFVCPGLVGGEPFWWDRIAGADGRGLGPELRERLMEDEGGQAGRIREAHPDEWEVPSDLLPATLDELRRAGASPGLTFGAHTWSHPNLTRVDADDLETELRESDRWLEREAIGDILTGHLTFPYGRYDEATVDAASRGGYRWLYRVEGGAANPRGARERENGPTVLPRINIPAGVSLRGFELRVSGLMS